MGIRRQFPVKRGDGELISPADDAIAAVPGGKLRVAAYQDGTTAASSDGHDKIERGCDSPARVDGGKGFRGVDLGRGERDHGTPSCHSPDTMSLAYRLPL